MKIEIWSDVICPFCYIGKTQLETALKAFPGAGDVTIEHRAYRLMPGEPVHPVAEMFAKKYGQGPEQAKASARNVEAMAAQAGLDFHIDGTNVGDTTRAHLLLALAADKGTQMDLLDLLYRAYFTEGRDIFDREVLLTVGEEAGLARDDMVAALASPELAARVIADQQQAQAFNVRGVPFVVIDRKMAVSGAQPPETFLQALNAVAAQSPKPVAAGDACGPDGCPI